MEAEEGSGEVKMEACCQELRECLEEEAEYLPGCSLSSEAGEEYNLHYGEQIMMLPHGSFESVCNPNGI